MIPSFIAANLSHTPSIVTQIDRAKSMRQESITATVNWNMVQGTTTRLGFGLNAFQGFRPASFNSAAYRSNMALIKPGFIRFHNGSALQDSSVPDGLIDRRRRTWDANKVKSALSASVTTFGQDQPQRMINIPTWADWMDADR
ncbi:MAG: hypothetical protein MUC48_16030, partial [Leptolyngbya sp. Prado105]|nr:hypothetical protein [Leptolyngbya sp. Prado105]